LRMMRMEQKEYEWIPHLEEIIPEKATGYTLPIYTIALEAWRRGITVKFFNDTHKTAHLKYSLSFQEKEHFFKVSRGDLVSRKAVKICIDKHLTKKHLWNAGVPAPAGNEFSGDIENTKIVEYAIDLGFPVVIKPSKGTGGKGVIANIQNEDEFKEALTYIRED